MGTYTRKYKNNLEKAELDFKLGRLQDQGNQREAAFNLRQKLIKMTLIVGTLIQR